MSQGLTRVYRAQPDERLAKRYASSTDLIQLLKVYCITYNYAIRRVVTNLIAPPTCNAQSCLTLVLSTGVWR